MLDMRKEGSQERHSEGECGKKVSERDEESWSCKVVE